MSRFGVCLLDNRLEEVMPFKRSKNRAINYLQVCGWSVVWELNYLRDHLKGLVTSENTGWWDSSAPGTAFLVSVAVSVADTITSAKDFCHEMVKVVGCKRSSLALEWANKVLQSLDSAVHMTMRLIHDEDLHGDDLIHAEDVYNRLEEIRPEILEVIRIHEKYGSDDFMKYEKATERDLMDIVY